MVLSHDTLWFLRDNRVIMRREDVIVMLNYILGDCWLEIHEYHCTTLFRSILFWRIEYSEFIAHLYRDYR